jgi:hypothetical protein
MHTVHIPPAVVKRDQLPAAAVEHQVKGCTGSHLNVVLPPSQVPTGVDRLTFAPEIKQGCLSSPQQGS